MAALRRSQEGDAMTRPPPDIEPIDTASAMFSGLSELHERQIRRARLRAAAWGFALGVATMIAWRMM